MTILDYLSTFTSLALLFLAIYGKQKINTKKLKKHISFFVDTMNASILRFQFFNRSENVISMVTIFGLLIHLITIVFTILTSYLIIIDFGQHVLKLEIFNGFLRALFLASMIIYFMSLSNAIRKNSRLSFTSPSSQFTIVGVLAILLFVVRTNL